MEKEKLKRWIDEAQWRATTYLAPHEYVLFRDYPELHKALKAYLLDHGYTGRFLDREYTYTNMGAYRYWIVEGVLNRARLDTPGVFASSALAGSTVFKASGRIEGLIEEAEWTVAKHGASPHEYVLKKDEPELFVEMRAFIKENGYYGRFLDRVYFIGEIGDYRYWYMSEGSESIILNRALRSTPGVERLEGMD